jgi:uncharacterized protein YjbI with pentapeptide repeats
MPLPIPPREPDAVPVLNATPLPAFTQSWQLQPSRDAVILIVKGTFDLTPRAPATPSEEQQLPIGPEPFEGAEEALRYPGDIAFYKPRCDVFVAGHAYASARQKRAVRRLEINLGRELTFALAAIGDRTWVRGAPSEPAPFDRIELRPERAFGGPGDETNPIGLGRGSADGSPLPNFELPDRLLESVKDRPPPAMTTPIAQTWPARAKLAGSYGGDWAKKRAPYFPDDFRWDYFQAAPPPLQIAYPRGDEPYRLHGFRPNDEELEGRLPCLKMRGFAQPKVRPDELLELTLHLDTIFFEPDLLRVQLVWRGAMNVADPYSTDLASLFVLAEVAGHPAPMEEIRRRFEQAYRAEHVREPEVDEPDPIVPEVAPDGYVPPIGLDVRRARALGLAPWAATIDSPPLAIEPPPPPRATMEPRAIDALLSSGRSLAGMDLSHCDLRSRDLRGRDLTDAILISARLDGADLSGARLAGAALSDASLAGATLRGADLGRAVLERASLEGAVCDDANLTEASLSGARAIGASFIRAKLDGAILYEADLTRVKLDGARLVGADLTSARLEQASLVSASMQDVRLYDAIAPMMIADDADMTRCRIDRGMFAGSSFARVRAAQSSMRKCDFSDCNLTGATLERSVLEDSILDRACMNQIEAKGARWHRARAREATFVKANLMGGTFEGVHFAECDMRGVNLYDADTFRSRIERCRFDHAILGVSGLE